MMDWREVDRILSSELPSAFGSAKRILLIIPDATRSGPVAQIVPRVLEVMRSDKRHADIIVALGTHPAMPGPSLLTHVGLDQERIDERFPGMRIMNHEWSNPSALATFGEIPESRVAELTDGLMRERVSLTLNRVVTEYDLLLILGPVFPHELVGFSGGSKYLFPGISGREMIDVAHWAGALRGNLNTIAVIDTPIRRLLDEGMRRLPFRTAAIKMVVSNGNLEHLFVGGVEEAWRKAAVEAGRLHVRRLPRPYRRVIASCPDRYPDFWLAGKGMYKCEGAVADGGELVIFAPHVETFSDSHAQVIERVGYHVRDYFLANWERFRNEPRSVLAHCIVVRGEGTYVNGIESPRIRVTLASRIPAEKCRRAGLEYADPAEISRLLRRKSMPEDTLLVENAGETLFLAGEHARNDAAERESPRKT
jgi:lactate racemase